MMNEIHVCVLEISTANNRVRKTTGELKFRTSPEKLYLKLV